MEEIHYLIPEKLKIIQNNDFFKFGTDSVLLSDFVDIRGGERVLDLGCGSGVIPLLLAYKKNPSRVIGLEIQADLVEMSRRSVEMNGLKEKIEIREGDLKEIGNYIRNDIFDIVVSNPPYTPVNAGKITNNRRKAIARHEITVNLDDVVKSAAFVLINNGSFFMVHRSWRMSEVFTSLRKYNLEPKKLRLVQSRYNKSPDMFLIKAIKGANGGLNVEPVLIVYEGDSIEYTEEVKKIYGEI